MRSVTDEGRAEASCLQLAGAYSNLYFSAKAVNVSKT